MDRSHLVFAHYIIPSGSSFWYHTCLGLSRIPGRLHQHSHFSSTAIEIEAGATQTTAVATDAAQRCIYLERPIASFLSQHLQEVDRQAMTQGFPRDGPRNTSRDTRVPLQSLLPPELSVRTSPVRPSSACSRGFATRRRYWRAKITPFPCLASTPQILDHKN